MAAVASRYARAFADVVFERRLDPQSALTDLDSVAAMLSGSPDLRTVLENPGVPPEQKLHLLDAIAKQSGISRELRNLVAVIIDHRRIGLFEEIAQSARQEINERLGVAQAEVTTARELTADEKRLLEEKIARTSGKRITAQYSLDPTLVGGVRVKVGSTIYDGSVRGKLDRMREQLTEA